MVHEITASIEFQMSLLLFVALTGYQVASRINQSAVIGEILVGLLVGPSLLGLITYTDFVNAMAHLGAVVLLFVVGLELKVKEVYNLDYGIIALAGVAVPWFFGYLLASLFEYGFGSAVLVGTALSATSIAITAEVLREMGVLNSPAAKAIIGAAVIDDVLSLVALAASEQLILGEFSILYLSVTMAKAVGFLAVGTLLGMKVLTRHMLIIDKSKIAGRYPELVFIYAMMVAFLYGMIAELIGLSTIVGAFVAGISLEGIRRLEHSMDYKEGARYMQIIFASVFFVSLGILADVRALHADTLWFLAALTLAAILTKLIGCAVPAKMEGMSTEDSLIVGFGMVPRGEIAMVVALIGLNQGILNQDVYVSLVMMSLITTIIPPLILRKLVAKSQLGGEGAAKNINPV